jgi:Asp-tRNA(Asn)/Glu-tRNA(Gln) amidotransferase A subunit family amidase
MEYLTPAEAGHFGEGGQTLVAPAPLVSTASRLRDGSLALTEYVEQVERRVRSVDPHIRALLPEPDRLGRMLREAAHLLERFPDPASRPPLYGVAVGVKDLFSVDGFPTRAGSELPAELFAGPEAPVVTALRASGAIILGKTAMDELAYSEPSPARNPHNLEHTPGGSSSGSAAAVAAGLCPLALGTQTSRSVIGPAAFCGVVGFKSTYGRIPIDGVVPLSPAFDTVGLLTQDVAGMALAAAALVPRWQAIASQRRPILGVPDGRFLTWTLEEGRAAFETHVARLAQAGYEVRRVAFFSDDEMDEMDRLAMTLLPGEMARVHATWFDEHSERYRPGTARGVLRGRSVTDRELDDIRAHQRWFQGQVATLTDEAGIDLWITPASAGPAPLGFDVTGWGGMTTAWSYAGLPCITVPAGRAKSGLPLGVQAIARRGQDEALLAAACGLESGLRI